ncbi:MAG: hypothetical protein FH762_06990 [Firmicutes bacterium]|nr:hypothetical protein [Bacillota bacterium]
MSFFLSVFFMFIGIVGLIYKVETGVFVGFGLLPWQIIRLKKGSNYNIIAIVLSTVIGSGFFIVVREWVLLFLFLFIQGYNYWGHLQTEKREDNE